MIAFLAPASIFSVVGSVIGSPFKAAANIGLSTVSGWIVDGAEAMLGEVVKLISLVTTPSLTASWFAPGYWRIAALATFLTVPFLFAAAVQAVVRTDLSVLIRAAFVDLPIAALAVTITAPVVALLLAATDEMCALVTGGGPAGGSFLSQTAMSLPHLGTGLMPVVIAIVILLAGMALLVELIMRAAAIYVVVLFLPLGFAAMVWPARRVWIKRMVELLIALILSKFAMVAILSVAVAGVASITPSPSSLSTALTAMALMVLAAFSPWALVRLLPFTEVAAGISELRHTTYAAGGRGLGLANRTAGLAQEVAGPMLGGFDALANFTRGGASRQGDQDGGEAPLLFGAGAGLNATAAADTSASTASTDTGVSGGESTQTGPPPPPTWVSPATSGAPAPSGGHGSAPARVSMPGPTGVSMPGPAGGSVPEPAGGSMPGSAEGPTPASAADGPIPPAGDVPSAPPPGTATPLDPGPVENLSRAFRHGEGLPNINLDPALPGGVGAFEVGDLTPDERPDDEAER